ncbi:Chymotrypsin-2 [Pseudolycoriella hygida]|uniref:Chymotrypsin-2 n=1 Tax=Pseudolycoriella hygida TaxID=35572 RepID=A0A9Q0ML86_9DIPT|nr:Chymotrypsin-2 [Pseudolycoriella hygida]
MRYWAFLLFFNVAKVLCEPKPIVGGRTAQPNTYGYQVSLRYPDINKTPWHFCGGSIVTIRCILTAAHCASIENRKDRDITKTLVYCGTLYTKENRYDNPDIYEILWFKKHEQFDPESLLNDVAVIATKRQILFDYYRVWPIHLAWSRPADDQFVTITGWGFIQNDPNAIPDKLQVISSLQILNQNKCMELNPTRPGFPAKNVTSTNICVVGSPGQATCQGDSGGPAVYNGKQFGLVSFGSKDCANAKRIALTCVCNYIYWIQRQVLYGIY